MTDKPISHYKEDFEHACEELKRQDKELSILRKGLGAKNLEIDDLKERLKEISLRLEQGR